MGKPKAPTIGFWHKMTLYMGECFGEVDALRKIEAGGEVAWEGNLTASGDIVIDKPNLFGGEKKEGGIRGTLSVRMGEATQMPHPLMVALRPGPWPAARGLVTTVFDGDIGALSPYVKAWTKLWSRWLKGWRTPVWQPALCKVGEGMNPAHIIYQCMTDPAWAAGGLPTSIIDEPSFLKAAQTLFDEGFGLCLKWARSTPVRNFIATVCNHIGAEWAEDPSTGRICLTLFRPDYDVETLPMLDGSNIVEMTSWETPTLGNSVNEVTVVGRDCLTNSDISATYHNRAAIMAQRAVVNEKKEFPGLWNLDLCARVAARETLVASTPTARIKVKVQRKLWGIKRGDVLAISWPRKGVERMPVRVLEVDEGTLTDSAIGLVLVQDINGMAASTYITPSTTVWTPPDTTPQPVAAQLLYEASFRDLSAFMRPADLAMVEPEAGYVVALGARPGGVTINYELHTRVGAAPFDEVSTGDFTPTAVVAAAIPRSESPVAVNLTFGKELDLVEVGDQAIIGNECLRVDAINVTAGTATLARGCIDTVPQAHDAGSRVWFPESYYGADPTEYLDGETVDAKLLTRTSQGALALGLATTISITLDARQFRPYPPARVRVDGVVFTGPDLQGSVALSWSHRDRLLQADQLVDNSAVIIGPEPDTTYEVVVRNRTTSAVVRTVVGIIGAAWTYTDADAVADGTLSALDLELRSRRDSLPSWQSHRVLIDRYGLGFRLGEKLGGII